MKFCYKTNLIIGIISLFLEVGVIYRTVNSNQLQTRDVLFLIGQLIGLSIFGVMGIMLLVSASKLKKFMKLNSEEELFLK